VNTDTQCSSQSTLASDIIHSFRLRLLTMPRGVKQALMIVADVFSYSFAAAIALWLMRDAAFQSSSTLLLVALAASIGILIHSVLGTYVSIVRFMGFAFLAVSLRATFYVAVLVVAISYAIQLIDSPLRVGIVFWAFSLIMIVCGRLTARLFLRRSNRNREPVVIYGAGEGGAQLADALFTADDYLPVAFVDDKSSLHGKRIFGVKVYPVAQLESLIEEKRARGVLLAIPSASRRRRRQVLERLSEFPTLVQTMPELRDIVSGKARIDDVRKVDVDDLLGRNQVPPVPELLHASITGKSVMVTGAGGSIGSELCRQILRLKPTKLVCFELSEHALYGIDQELRQLSERHDISCEIVSLLGSVIDGLRVQEAMQTFKVQTVYHAAAYKHVPIVEQNLLEGIRNNVLGTLRCAEAATEAGVESFVLVSTDKAVNPTSVMGATKRMAELILQAYAAQQSHTRFCMVRFGNVLESSGSVVPLFRKQILDGGPVTVTHREIIRFFMTIPEAAQLVIQAGSMGDGGDVFVLDMGQPVRIGDLAHRMINLMGLSVQDQSNPHGDIEIQYTGLRPAEKLYEELLIGSNTSGTEHPRIMRATEDFLPIDILEGFLGELEKASSKLDYCRARQVLHEAVKEYMPTEAIDDLVWMQKAGMHGKLDFANGGRFPCPR